MNKKNIIISIIAISLLVLVSLSNVVGYNTIKSSQEELIESKYSFDECKDYLFQTIVEISENAEIKDIIKSNHKPQRTILPFRRSNVELRVEHLELLYEMGLKIIDRLGEEQIEELMENIEIPDYADELDAFVMGNEELRERIYTLNEMNGKLGYFRDWPIICFILSLVIVPIVNFAGEHMEIIGMLMYIASILENNRDKLLYSILYLIANVIALQLFLVFFLYLFFCVPFPPY